ncbi:TolB family protein [Cyclobacterium salsum]|uniref:TolB family protein n=1 Tax=Cyclobacterium salsum TaxID=2666329 RepID=UPI0013914542|nr:DPP IV N-terminal domain-containing protein [Cyclobacterium salsum]
MKTPKSLFYLIFLLSLSTATAAFAQSPQEPLNLDDLGDMVVLRQSPSISPDGNQVVLVREHSNFEQNRWERSLELIDLETGEQHELTPERPRANDPKWSPNGDRLAFLDAGDEGQMQVYVLPMKGGGEARRLTSGKEGVRFYEWSPDGRSIVFGRMDEPEERKGEERHNRSFEVGVNSYLTQSRQPK